MREGRPWRGPHPLVAAALSAVWPGLGHMGHRNRRGLLLAAATLAVAAGGIAYFLTRRAGTLLTWSVTRPSILALMVATICALAFRWAVAADAFATAARRRPARSSSALRRLGKLAALLLLALFIAAPHLVVIRLAAAQLSLLSEVFVAVDTQTARPTPLPTTPTETDAPDAADAATTGPPHPTTATTDARNPDTPDTTSTPDPDTPDTTSTPETAAPDASDAATATGPPHPTTATTDARDPDTPDTTSTTETAAPDAADAATATGPPHPTTATTDARTPDTPDTTSTPDPDTPDTTGSSDATPQTGATRTTTPQTTTRDGADRLTIALLGSDGGYRRSGVRTDTIIVLSIDVATGDAAAFNVPRNWTHVTFPEGTPAADRWPDGYPGIANEIYGLGLRHPDAFPGVEDKAGHAVKLALAQLTGLDIQYYVMVDFVGFVKAIDLFGGIEVQVRESVKDRIAPIVAGGRHIAINVGPGYHRLDGLTTLAYVRSRAGSSDYHRMTRQRCVVGALIDQVAPLEALARYVALTDIISQHVKTDIPLDRLGDLIAEADRLDTSRIVTVNFIPPVYKSGSAPIAQVREAVAQALEGHSNEANAVLADTCGGPA